MVVYSSHGELFVDIDTGVVDRKRSVYCGVNNPEKSDLWSIERFDIEEHCVFWGCDQSDLAGVDILDLGYWDSDGVYEPPAMGWRLDDSVLSGDDWPDGVPVPESVTPCEMLEIISGQ